MTERQWESMGWREKVWEDSKKGIHSHRQTFRQRNEISWKKIPNENNSFCFWHSFENLFACVCVQMWTSKHFLMHDCSGSVLNVSFHDFGDRVETIQNGYHYFLPFCFVSLWRKKKNPAIKQCWYQWFIYNWSENTVSSFFFGNQSSRRFRIGFRVCMRIK